MKLLMRIVKTVGEKDRGCVQSRRRKGWGGCEVLCGTFSRLLWAHTGSDEVRYFRQRNLFTGLEKGDPDSRARASDG
jgi:hypothetical protein